MHVFLPEKTPPHLDEIGPVLWLYKHEADTALIRALLSFEVFCLLSFSRAFGFDHTIMTDSSCRQSRAVHEDAIEHEAHSIDADTRHDFISNDRPHYLDVHDQLGRQYRDSHSPEPAPHFPIRHGENYSSHRTHTPQNDTPLLSDHETDSSASLGTTEDQLTNSSQRPALDQSAQHLGPTWTEVYFRPLFLVPLATLLALMIVLLEVLNSISQQNQGLVTASEHMHYIWTYGPTFCKFELTGLDHFWDMVLMEI